MTNQELNAENVGAQLGTEGVASVVANIEAYCAHEEQRITLTHQPKIVALQAEASWLLDEERELVDRLRLAPPPGDLRSRRRKAVYYGCVTALLTLAAFVFSLYSFAPFRLGVKASLYCLGIAVVTPFLADRIMERWKAETLIKWLTTFACAAALASLVLLAVVRGNLLAEEIKNAGPVIVLDDAPAQQPQNTFYERTTPLLQLVMALLAVAMELGAGLALHDAWRLGSDSKEDWGKLRKRLAEGRARLAALAFEITTLQLEPQTFNARFWRNFYRAMLTHTVRSAMTKLVVGLLAIPFVAHERAAAQNHTTVVIAVDLTQSVAVVGPDQKSEFEKNIEAVSRLLAQVQADSRVTVIGITDHSFTQPDLLLSATIPADAGYFGERLAAARAELVRAWKTRSSKLQPRYRSTDILGALMLAGQVFDQKNAGRKVLVVYSDMRHHTADLDLESPVTPPRFAPLRTSYDPAGWGLRDAEFYVLGVDGAGKSTTCWRALRQFWTDFLAVSGARLKGYSALRSPPELR
jgi:hypothetical protein